jgi:hypothetical protein
MDTTRFVRLAPLTGLGFFAFAFAGAVTMGESPDFVADPSEFTDYFMKNPQRIATGAWVFCLGLVLLIWFLGTLCSAARAAEGGDGRVSRIAYGGAITGVGLELAGMACYVVGAFRADDRGGIPDDIAAVYGDLAVVLGFLAAAFAFGTFLAALAVVNLRTPFLPQWVTWLSVLLAIVMLIPFISWLGTIVFALWCAVVSSLLFFRSDPISPAS